MTIEFEAFAVNGHHGPIWVMDIMIALVSRGIICAIQDSLLFLGYNELKGKGLKITSTFNLTSPMMTGSYGHGERDG